MIFQARSQSAGIGFHDQPESPFTIAGIRKKISTIGAEHDGYYYVLFEMRGKSFRESKILPILREQIAGRSGSRPKDFT
jgi:hypothetical protein